jgi:hypothetical protein
MLKMIVLQRQARDKHTRESLKTEIMRLFLKGSIFIENPTDDMLDNITLTVDDKPVQVKRSYNSRGLNHSRTFLGYYFIATDMTVDKPHHLSLSLPKLPTGAFTGANNALFEPFLY